jgi:hypothetical protein
MRGIKALLNPTLRQETAKVGWPAGSGPGGRRFKSSLPDQFFQSLTIDFWYAALSGVGDFEAAKASKINKLSHQSKFSIQIDRKSPKTRLTSSRSLRTFAVKSKVAARVAVESNISTLL